MLNEVVPWDWWVESIVSCSSVPWPLLRCPPVHPGHRSAMLSVSSVPVYLPVSPHSTLPALATLLRTVLCPMTHEQWWSQYSGAQCGHSTGSSTAESQSVGNTVLTRRHLHHCDTRKFFTRNYLWLVWRWCAGVRSLSWSVDSDKCHQSHWLVRVDPSPDLWFVQWIVEESDF